MTGSDGAHLGVSADRALDTILGGKPSPAEDEQMDAETFRTWIKTADREDDYGEAARLCARYLLEYLEAHPEHIGAPLEDEYDYERAEADLGKRDTGAFWDRFSDPKIRQQYVKRVGVFDAAARETPKLHEMDLTGFMVGWAFNAARRCLELPPARNPALLTVEISDGSGTSA